MLLCGVVDFLCRWVSPKLYAKITRTVKYHFGKKTLTQLCVGTKWLEDNAEALLSSRWVTIPLFFLAVNHISSMSILQAAIWQCLNQHKIDDAIFLSERLHAELRSDESLFLLGTSYYRAGRLNATKILLNGTIFTLRSISTAKVVVAHVEPYSSYFSFPWFCFSRIEPSSMSISICAMLHRIEWFGKGGTGLDWERTIYNWTRCCGQRVQGNNVFQFVLISGCNDV